ncbi:Methyltransferase type 11 [Spirochaeta thermophila DSM 6578]|uniref:Methyltransferase type 11 n=1 Tax=Winmispira thermophila (strain ATCC 700085 / DSM 6578 / Z-1203) TaxID=869211 RepID=G0GCA2_WINT7|nr:class I SAM-dependent methyltransferase [Spirochaeta thermophila]AEJ61187.1 Methyltransferase type 11 [Spirochaeta thermophila DSM 6578]
MKTYSSIPGDEPVREIPCYVCGSEERLPFWKGEGFGYVRCRACGFVYQYPQPVPRALHARYDQRYFQYELENEENFFQLMLKGLRDVGFFWLERTLPVRRFLDIGCATGRLIAHLSSRGWETKGVEICHHSVCHAREHHGVDVFEGTLEEAPFEPESFSVIHSSHVIEHVPDPVSFLERIHSLLVPGGWCILVTPNREGLQARLLKERWRSAIPDHVFLFTKRHLSRLLVRAGLSPVRWKTWGGIAKGLAPEYLKRPLDVLAKWWGFGDVMIVLSRKTGALLDR